MTRTIRLLLLSLAVGRAARGLLGRERRRPSVASARRPRRERRPGASPSPSAPTDPQEAFLAYAACMREHGIDMPDPQVSDEGGGKFSVGFSAEGRRRRGPTRRSSRRPTRHAGRSSRTRSARAAGRSCRPRTRRSCSTSPAACASTASTCPTRGEGGMVFEVGGPGDADADRSRGVRGSPGGVPGPAAGPASVVDGPGLQIGAGRRQRRRRRRPRRTRSRSEAARPPRGGRRGRRRRGRRRLVGRDERRRGRRRRRARAGADEADAATARRPRRSSGGP